MIKKVTVALAACIAMQTSFQPIAANAQGQPNVSVVNLSVQPGANGNQMVVTPRGYLVPLPGPGVNGNVLQLYMGSTGGYWYQDRQGQTIDVTSYVQQIRSQTAQQVAPPQYAPYPTQYQQPQQQYAQEQPQNTSSSSSSSSGGSGSSLGTAVAAGMGAMAGSAISNGAYYNHMPYGTPYYYGNDGRPFYNDDHGKNVFVNEDGDVKWNNVYAANTIKTNNQKEKAQQVNSAREQHNATQSAQNQQLAQSAQAQRQNYQQQQNWYQGQMKDSGRAQTWQQQSAGENPFVRGGGEGRGEGRGDRQTARGERGGGERSFGGGGGARARGAGGGGRGGGRRGR